MSSEANKFASKEEFLNNLNGSKQERFTFGFERMRNIDVGVINKWYEEARFLKIVHLKKKVTHSIKLFVVKFTGNEKYYFTSYSYYQLIMFLQQIDLKSFISSNLTSKSIVIVPFSSLPLKNHVEKLKASKLMDLENKFILHKDITLFGTDGLEELVLPSLTGKKEESNIAIMKILAKLKKLVKIWCYLTNTQRN